MVDNYEKEMLQADHEAEDHEEAEKCKRCIHKFDFNKCKICIHRHWKPKHTSCGGQLDN